MCARPSQPLPSSDAFWVLCEAYQDAGDCTLETIQAGTYKGGLAIVPCIFLYFRSIELGLKSVLVYHQLSAEEITRKLGHRISELLVAVEAFTQLSVIGITADDRLTLDEFSADYSGKSFEYSDDWFQLPDVDGLKDLSHRVCEAVARYERGRDRKDPTSS